MEDHNHNHGDVEIVKEAEVHVNNYSNNNDKALLKVLKNEISHLKASNASLKIRLQHFREKHLPNVLLVDDNYDTVQIITEILNNNYNILYTGNGIEALNIPIIFCSANNTKKDVIKAISFGADDYIIKPFQENTLLENVGKWTKNG